jgi:hypothetical protein
MTQPAGKSAKLPGLRFDVAVRVAGYSWTAMQRDFLIITHDHHRNF